MDAIKILEEVMRFTEKGEDNRAIDVLFNYGIFTGLPANEEMALHEDLMSEADVEKLPISSMLALLSMSLPRCSQMPGREEFFNKVERELLARGESEERIERLLKGLDCRDGGARARWGYGIIKRVLGIR